MTDTPTTETCAAKIEATLDEVFASAERIGKRTQQVWRDAISEHGAIHADDLTALQPVIFAELDARPHYSGAGFLAEPGVLADADRFLEWWQPHESEGHTRLRLNLDPASPDDYDYPGMDWYVGAKSGLSSVRGPYLDYAGADRFVLTFALPVVLDDAFVGTSGVDVLMAAFDPLLFDHVRTDARPLVLVDGYGRVIVSNTPDASPSERLRAATDDGVPVGGDGVGWRLYELT